MCFLFATRKKLLIQRLNKNNCREKECICLTALKSLLKHSTALRTKESPPDYTVLFPARSPRHHVQAQALRRGALTRPPRSRSPPAAGARPGAAPYPKTLQEAQVRRMLAGISHFTPDNMTFSKGETHPYGT